MRAVHSLILGMALIAVLFAALHERSTTSADSLSFTLIASSISQATSITHAGDERLFITQKGGLIKVWDGSSVLATPFLDMTGQVSTTSEDGLLGLAFHPEYETNGRFFIDYVNLDGDVVIAEYAVSGDPDVADPTGTPVLTIAHPSANIHNGGQIAFGPDGYLYISVGDAANPPSAQNINSLHGKILRIDVDSAAPYAIPPDNPFAAAPGADEVWAYGLRNPWRMSFDRLTGDLFIGDVGQDVTEEVNFQPTSSTGGENYGWPTMEGPNCFSPPVGCNQTGLTMPVIHYGHENDDCSVTGGYRYRGPDELLEGKYIYGDFCTGRIWAATPDGGGVWTSELLADTSFVIPTFGEGADGDLYLASFSGASVYRVESLDTDGDGVGDASDNCPAVANPDQANNDANFIDQSSHLVVNDHTMIISDELGDACDDDDDNDGLTDVQELDVPCASASAPTDPLELDSDGDRVGDGAECAMGTDPASGASAPDLTPPGDSDGDRLTDAFELSIGTDPNERDSDGDGLGDGVEYLFYGSDPLSVNSDGDACGDMREATSFDTNEFVTAADLGLAATQLGSVPPNLSNMDVDKNGAVTAADLGMVAANLGPCP